MWKTGGKREVEKETGKHNGTDLQRNRFRGGGEEMSEMADDSNRALVKGLQSLLVLGLSE